MKTSFNLIIAAITFYLLLQTQQAETIKWFGRTIIILGRK